MTNGCKVQRLPRENQKQRSVVIAMETSDLTPCTFELFHRYLTLGQLK